MHLSDYIKEKTQGHMKPDSVHRAFCMKSSSVQIAEKTGAEADQDLSNRVSNRDLAEEKWSFIKDLQDSAAVPPQMSTSVFPTNDLGPFLQKIPNESSEPNFPHWQLVQEQSFQL